MSITGFITNRSDLAIPVVTGNNLLFDTETLIVTGPNGCPEPGIGIVTGNNIFPGIGIGVVNPPMALPAAECPLQDLQRTGQTLLTRLYMITTPCSAAV